MALLSKIDDVIRNSLFQPLTDRAARRGTSNWQLARSTNMAAMIGLLLLILIAALDTTDKFFPYNVAIAAGLLLCLFMQRRSIRNMQADKDGPKASRVRFRSKRLFELLVAVGYSAPVLVFAILGEPFPTLNLATAFYMFTSCVAEYFMTCREPPAEQSREAEPRYTPV